MSVVFPPYDAPGHPVGMTSLLDVTISQTRPPPKLEAWTGLVQEPTPASLSITSPHWAKTYHIYARYKDRLTCGAIHFPQNPSPRRLSRQISTRLNNSHY